MGSAQLQDRLRRRIQCKGSPIRLLGSSGTSLTSEPFACKRMDQATNAIWVSIQLSDPESLIQIFAEILVQGLTFNPLVVYTSQNVQSTHAGTCYGELD